MEDAVEVFLQPKAPNGPLYQFVVNALGTYYDALDNDPTFDCKAQIAARREAKSWSVEMALPWKELKLSPPRSGEVWGFNVGREHRPKEPTEWSTWAPLREGLQKFAVPEGFGRLEFSGEGGRGGRVSYLAPNATTATPAPAGAQSEPGILEMADSVPPEERPVGETWPTPHLASYRPLSGGPVRALIFVGDLQRDAVELAQRLDLEYDYCYCPKFRKSGLVERTFAWNAAEVLRRLESGHYDVVVLAGRPSHPDVVDSLVRWVQEGKGLVYIGPTKAEGPADAKTFKKLTALLPPPLPPEEAKCPWMKSLPVEFLKLAGGDASPLSKVAQKEVGKGRVVRIQWAQPVEGLVPSAGPTPQATELLYAIISRAALWAAKREPACDVAQLQFQGGQLMVSLQALTPGRRDVHLSWDTEIGQPPVEATRQVDLAAGLPAEVRFEIPPELSARQGLQLARVQVTGNKGAVEGFAVAARRVEIPTRIAKISAPEEVAPDAAIPVTVTLTAPSDAEYTLRAELVDAFDRVIARSERKVAQKESQVVLELRARNPLSVYHIVSASLYAGTTLVDQARTPIWIPRVALTHTDDFRLGAGYAAMQFGVPSHLCAYAVNFLRQQGVTAMTVSEETLKHGMAGWGGTAAGMGMSYKGTDHVRTPCFSNPALRRELAEKTAANIAAKQKWGWVGYNMTDEVHLHQDSTVEVCTCAACAEGFRKWARSAYGTIQNANASWGTSYTDFSDITPPLLAEMKGQTNPARWVDFRMFEEEVWAGAYAETVKAVKARRPDARMSFTNPYRFDSLSGTNFWLWAPHEDILLKYFHPHVLDPYRSFSKAPMVAWFGYRTSGDESARFLWRFALNGGVMPIWWDSLDPWAYAGKKGFTPWNLCDPLWRPTGRSMKVTAAATELEAGISQLFRLAHRPKAKVAVLYSQQSMHVLYALAALPKGRPTSAGYDRWLASFSAFTGVLQRNAIEYQCIAPAQVEDGKTSASSVEPLAAFEVLALPAAVALSDKALGAIRKFVAGGGKVVADVEPGAYTEHGSPRADSAPLADLHNSPGWACLGRQALERTDPDQLAAAFQKLGIRGDVQWEANGALPQDAELYRFELGEAQYVALLPVEKMKSAEGMPITVHLPHKAHVYNMRAGKYLGQGSTLKGDLTPDTVAVFSLLPYQVNGLEASAETGEDPQGAVIRARVIATAQPTDHVFHVEFTSPQGEKCPWYSRNILAPGGAAEMQIPFALSDPAGVWTAQVTDVATGAKTTVQIRR
jgi:hypothetical protein